MTGHFLEVSKSLWQMRSHASIAYAVYSICSVNKQRSPSQVSSGQNWLFPSQISQTLISKGRRPVRFFFPNVRTLGCSHDSIFQGGSCLCVSVAFNVCFLGGWNLLRPFLFFSHSDFQPYSVQPFKVAFERVLRTDRDEDQLSKRISNWHPSHVHYHYRAWMVT